MGRKEWVIRPSRHGGENRYNGVAMMEQHHTPLTKEILTEALLGLEERLDSKLQRFATKDALRNVQVAVARLEGDMHEVKHALKTRFATKKDMEPYRLLAERALKELDEHRELRSTRGALLTDVAEKVEDHERRLRGIEGRS
jgi:hypothetical protein